MLIVFVYSPAVLYEDAVILGAENETILLSADSYRKRPFCLVSRTVSLSIFVKIIASQQFSSKCLTCLYVCLLESSVSASHIEAVVEAKVIFFYFNLFP